MIGGDKPLSYFGIDLGFEWRGLEFSMFWQGVYNKDVLMSDWKVFKLKDKFMDRHMRICWIDGLQKLLLLQLSRG